MAEREFDLADGLLVHQRLGPLDKGLVVPAVGHEQVAVSLRGEAHQFARVGSAGSQGFFAHHVQTRFQGGAGVFVVQGVRRGHHDSVEFAVGQ